MELELARELASLDPELVGRRLREARIKAGLTQPQAGAGAASVGYLSRLERGERRVGPELLEKICKNVGVAVDLIIRGAEPADPRVWQCELDFAELELATGETDRARQRVTPLLGDEHIARHSGMLERARLVNAKAAAASGLVEEAVVGFTEVHDVRATRSGWLEAAAALTRLLRETGELSKSIALAEGVLTELDDRPSDRDGTVKISMNLAASVYESGDVTRALDLCRQAVKASETAGSATSRAAAYWNTAIIACESGNLDEALNLTRRALALFLEVDDARLSARLRTQLGIFLLRADPPQTGEALKQLLDARDTYKVSDADVADMLHNGMGLARAYYAAGDLGRAETEASGTRTQSDGYPFVAATASTLLGRIAQSRGDSEGARTHLLDAIHQLTAVGADRRAAQQWFTLANLLDEMGFSEEAKDAFRRAAVSTGLTPSYGSTPSSHNVDA